MSIGEEATLPSITSPRTITSKKHTSDNIIASLVQSSKAIIMRLPPAPVPCIGTPIPTCASVAPEASSVVGNVLVTDRADCSAAVLEYGNDENQSGNMYMFDVGGKNTRDVVSKHSSSPLASSTAEVVAQKKKLSLVEQRAAMFDRSPFGNPIIINNSNQRSDGGIIGRADKKWTKEHSNSTVDEIEKRSEEATTSSVHKDDVGTPSPIASSVALTNQITSSNQAAPASSESTAPGLPSTTSTSAEELTSPSHLDFASKKKAIFNFCSKQSDRRDVLHGRKFGRSHVVAENAQEEMSGGGEDEVKQKLVEAARDETAQGLNEDSRVAEVREANKEIDTEVKAEAYVSMQSSPSPHLLKPSEINIGKKVSGLTSTFADNFFMHVDSSSNNPHNVAENQLTSPSTHVNTSTAVASPSPHLLRPSQLNLGHNKRVPTNSNKTNHTDFASNFMSVVDSPANGIHSNNNAGCKYSSGIALHGMVGSSSPQMMKPSQMNLGKRSSNNGGGFTTNFMDAVASPLSVEYKSNNKIYSSNTSNSSANFQDEVDFDNFNEDRVEKMLAEDAAEDEIEMDFMLPPGGAVWGGGNSDERESGERGSAADGFGDTEKGKVYDNDKNAVDYFGLAGDEFEPAEKEVSFVTTTVHEEVDRHRGRDSGTSFATFDSQWTSDTKMTGEVPIAFDSSSLSRGMFESHDDEEEDNATATKSELDAILDMPTPKIRQCEERQQQKGRFFGDDDDDTEEEFEANFTSSNVIAADLHQSRRCSLGDHCILSTIDESDEDLAAKSQLFKDKLTTEQQLNFIEIKTRYDEKIAQLEKANENKSVEIEMIKEEMMSQHSQIQLLVNQNLSSRDMIESQRKEIEDLNAPLNVEQASVEEKYAQKNGRRGSARFKYGKKLNKILKHRIGQ